MMLAKAVFDNTSETEEELSFKRGDVLTVLQIDTNGLEGWWLCSLKGKKGIAPGNRLKQMTGLKDDGKTTEVVSDGQTVVVQKNAYNSNSNGNNNRKSFVQDSTKVVTPKRVGNVFVFNNQEETKVPMEDYDVPVPGVNPLQNKLAMMKLHGYSTYDSPKLEKENFKVIEDIYNTPTNRYKMMNPMTMEHLGMTENLPGSNRSSGISVLSAISGTSNVSTHSDSSPVSGHSSFDATHDVYDIPPAPRHLISKSKSTSNVLDMVDTYDTPQKQRQKQLRHVKSEVKNVPPPIETWGGDYCEIQEKDERNVRISPDSGFGFSRTSEHYYEDPNLNKEHIIDDLLMYDSPKSALAKAGKAYEMRSMGRVQGYQTSQPVEKGGVYDVPPQVTKDSTMLSSDTSQKSSNSRTRLSTAGNNDPTKLSTDIAEVSYDELALEMNAAIELLVTLQQDLHKAITRLLAFVSSTWRKRDNLEPKMFDVKISCLAICTALQEYVEFGQGALANSVKLDDKNVFRKLREYLQPLQEATEKVIHSKKSLDGIKWDINKICTDLVDSTAVDDDLNKIVSVCKECVDLGKNLGSFIQGNATLLFQRNDYAPEPLVKPSNITTGRDHIRHKPPPPVRAKPKILVDKIKGVSEINTDCNSNKFTERPLPTPPLRRKEVQTTPLQKPLPPPPKHSTPEKELSGSDVITQQAALEEPGPASPINVYGIDAQDYDIPRTQQEVEDFQYLQKNFSRVIVDNNNEITDTEIYDNASTKISYNDTDGDQDYENNEAEQEYDYVALTPDQVKNSLAFKYFEEGTISKVLTNPSDMYDSPVGSRNSTSTTKVGYSANVSSNCPPGQMYDSPSAKPNDDYDSPQNNASVLKRGKNSLSGTSLDLDMSGQLEGMQVPSVRTSGLSSKFKEKMEKLQQEAETSVVTHSEMGIQYNVPLQQQRKSQVPQMDKQILAFYYSQVESHLTVLVHAMEALFQAVDYNQPPKVFIAHSKFVILAAHKLVYIGDTISRNLSSEVVRNGIMMCANQLCDRLKSTVTSTKRAALAYPSVTAVQEMVDRVVDVSNTARDMKTVIAQYTYT